MPIYKKDQPLPAQSVIVMIYGDPGTSKTSLANTTATPLILDFDRGFKRSYGRPDALIISEGWKEVEQLMQNGDFNDYKTIVIDTVKGALDDFIMPHVVESDYKLKTNKLKAFGELGEQFKLFVNKLRLMGKDVFIIAHAKLKEEGDVQRNIADITGSSGNLVLRIADQVGFLTMRNGKRVLSFNPTDTSVGKNVAGLPDIELPAHTSPVWNGFADREIMQKVKDALTNMSEEQRLALELISEWQLAIDVIQDDGRDVDAELKAITKDIKERVTAEHIQKQVLAYLVTHYKAIGWKYDGKQTKFLKVDTTAPAVKAETPPAQAAEAEKPAEKAPTRAEVEQQQQSDAIAQAAEERAIESASVANEKPPVINEADQIATQQQQAALATPQINANPHMPPPVNDLFAKRD